MARSFPTIETLFPLAFQQQQKTIRARCGQANDRRPRSQEKAGKLRIGGLDGLGFEPHPRCAGRHPNERRCRLVSSGLGKVSARYEGRGPRVVPGGPTPPPFPRSATRGGVWIRDRV